MKNRGDCQTAWRSSTGHAALKKLRASRRLLISTIQKNREAVNKKVIKPSCKVRTVELLPTSTQIVGDERSKLLFMMALGLFPNCEKKSNTGPVISLEKLNPIVESQIKARTKERMMSSITQAAYQHKEKLHFTSPISPNIPEYQPDPCDEIVEIIDLSSDDECSIIEVDDTPEAIDAQDNIVTIPGEFFPTDNTHCQNLQQSHPRDPRIRNRMNNSPPLALKMPAFKRQQRRTMKNVTSRKDKIACLYRKILRVLNPHDSRIVGKEISRLPRKKGNLALPVSSKSFSTICRKIVKRLIGGSCESHVTDLQGPLRAAETEKTHLVVTTPQDIITLD